MAGLMTAPMIIIEISLMKMMYMNKKINAAILITSMVASIGFFKMIRQQTPITDQQFTEYRPKRAMQKYCHQLTDRNHTNEGFVAGDRKINFKKYNLLSDLFIFSMNLGQFINSFVTFRLTPFGFHKKGFGPQHLALGNAVKVIRPTSCTLKFN